ncbi:MAG TPA: arsenite methyltransferase [Candidatus Limnocylindrales bacterium]
MTDEIHEAVRDRYARAARRVLGFAPQGGCSCGTATADEPQAADNAAATGPQAADSCCDETTKFGSGLYSALELGELPTAASMASLGCGNPLAVADLHEGERVLDLGSGGGIDVLLSARRVGPTGNAYGLDMTDEMLVLAAANAAEAGVTNVEWLKGQIEAIPLPADSIDVVISNCVVNLAADKPAVFREIARVLRPGGRIRITDVVADDSLTPAQRLERGDYAGCIAGALSFAEYRSGLEAAGLTDVSLTISHAVADRMYSAIVKAAKPGVPGVPAEPLGAGAAASATADDPRLEPVTFGSCC